MNEPFQWEGWAFPPKPNPPEDEARTLLRALVAMTRDVKSLTLPCGRFEWNLQGRIATIVDLKTNQLVATATRESSRQRRGQEAGWVFKSAHGEVLGKVKNTFITAIVPPLLPNKPARPVRYDLFVNLVEDLLAAIRCPVCEDEFGTVSSACQRGIEDSLIRTYLELRRGPI